jgi:hypothetical protein
MLPEIPVLGRDEGVGHHVGISSAATKRRRSVGEFVDDDTLARIDPADRGRRIVRQGVVVGQVVAVEEQQSTDAERGGDEPQRHGAERGAENPQNETDHTKIPYAASQASC